MKVKSITVGTKRSFAYQTFEVTMTVDIEANDVVDTVVKETQARCRKLAMEQIDLEKKK